MALRIDLRQKLTAQIARLIPNQTRPHRTQAHDKALNQELYESIALGNALADIEEDASRRWRG